MERLGEAKETYTRAIDIWENRTPWKENPEMADGLVSAYNNLGAALREMGRLEEAEEKCTRAIDIWENHTPWEENPEMARSLALTYANLGNALQMMGRREEACMKWNTARAILEGLCQEGYSPSCTELSRVREMLHQFCRDRRI